MWRFGLSGGTGGGAIIALYNATTTIENSVFAYNSADASGGAFLQDTSTATIVNSTFFANSAGAYRSDGGAIENGNNAALTINNSTIVGNSVMPDGHGSAIYNKSIVTATNTIIASNVNAPNCENNNGTFNDGGGNLRWPATDTSCPGSAGDPLLSALGNYGGATQTLGLMPGSAAINAGDSATCALTDQRGITRADFGQCDIGAFESRGFVLTIRKGDNQSAKINTAFADPLRVMVTSRYSEPVNGGKVIFKAPKNGASMKPQKATVLIQNGQALLNVKANGTSGAYETRAKTNGVKTPARFHLTNTK